MRRGDSGRRKVDKPIQISIRRRHKAPGHQSNEKRQPPPAERTKQRLFPVPLPMASTPPSHASFWLCVTCEDSSMCMRACVCVWVGVCVCVCVRASVCGAERIICLTTVRRVFTICQAELAPVDSVSRGPARAPAPGAIKSHSQITGRDVPLLRASRSSLYGEQDNEWRNG